MKKTLLTIQSFIIITALHAQTATEFIPGKIKLADSVFCTSVKDQGSSPTCWVFGTNSLFESDLAKEYKNVNFNLSEMFIARYAYIDKAKQFLASKGKTYFEGGGQFHDVIRVINKYGMVPEEAYSGLIKTTIHDHSGLDTAMKKILRQFLQEEITGLTKEKELQINDTLDKYLGRVPQTFRYNGRSYSPKTFSAEVIKFSNDYIEVVSFSDQPLYKKFILADKYNWASDSFYNITLDDMHMLVDTALHKGWSVGWEGDVTEKGFHYYSGYASFPDSAHQYDEERLKNYKTEATERDHMLQIAGIGKDENNKKWYYLKNSWGTYFNKYNGYLFMEENYFRMKTVILFVNKKGLAEELKKKLGIE